ncbi:MAG: dihydroorotate dehydrogenase electron transfer subunit [Firmicutes bacterium]|nr:dihydroorotate dehydrogenase electron transfer subunit [Bacillota bacterium]
MAKIISNKYLGQDIHVMKIEGNFKGEMGQFYMVRSWDNYPVLSRPLSIHDIDDEGISFLYRVVGDGTKNFSKLEANDEIKLEGPYGNGFPKVEGKVLLVGGGMGVAPLYLAAKRVSKLEDVEKLDVFMGFREKEMLKGEYEKYADNVHINVGGIITEDVDVDKYDYIFTCGPEIMMEKLVKMAEGKDTKVYVSIEKRMACGIGACLVCTCKTKDGNKKTCKDGPVFLGEDVFYE